MKGLVTLMRALAFEVQPKIKKTYFVSLNTILSILLTHFTTHPMMHTKELDMLIIQVEMELNLHKTHCHFLVAQLQDLEPNVSRKH